MSDERRILLGRVVGRFGVRGELRLESWTDPRSAIFGYQPWTLRVGTDELSIIGATGRDSGRNLIATLPGVEDRDAAQALIGAEIHVSRGVLPPPGPGEYYWVDLEGFSVMTVAGALLGAVSHLFSTGVNDVLVVQGERERLIPFLDGDVVKSVDFDARRIIVDWPPDF